jgi:hypothetical protein
VQCSYPEGLLIRSIVTMLQEGDDIAVERLYEYMKAVGVDIKDKKRVYAWFGERFENRQVEVSIMVFVFYTLAQEHKWYLDRPSVGLWQ